jgi:hypothetical protein
VLLLDGGDVSTGFDRLGRAATEAEVGNIGRDVPSYTPSIRFVR